MSVEVLDDGRKRISAPLSDEDVRALNIGDVVLINGTVYAARDAAHKRMVEMLDRVVPGYAVVFTSTVGPLSFEVKPAETVQLVIGGSGRPVVGSLAPPGDVSLPFDLGGAWASLVQEQPPFPGAAEMAGADRITFLARWYRTPEGCAWKLSYQGNPVRVGADGSFRSGGRDDCRVGPARTCRSGRRVRLGFRPRPVGSPSTSSQRPRAGVCTRQSGVAAKYG